MVVLYSMEEKPECRVVSIYQKRGNFIKVSILGEVRKVKLFSFKCFYLTWGEKVL